MFLLSEWMEHLVQLGSIQQLDRIPKILLSPFGHWCEKCLELATVTCYWLLLSKR